MHGTRCRMDERNLNSNLPQSVLTAVVHERVGVQIRCRSDVRVHTPPLRPERERRTNERQGVQIAPARVGKPETLTNSAENREPKRTQRKLTERETTQNPQTPCTAA
jgi:hypothetical protein